ncbi:MAG: glycosyltransferase family 39 protein, partial [Gammaproteobacteria bacterium]
MEITKSTSRMLLAAAIILLLTTKVFLASRLDLYSDEIFYWLASTRLSLAYSDLPFVTSLLVWLGTNLDPGNPLAVRVLFIVLGSSIPLLVFWLAQPITGRGQALFSAFLSLCIPLGGFLGLLAVPDVPLLFFGLLAIGFFERALRTDLNRYWLATGIAVALGLSTHYRFFLYPAAAVLFLLCYGPARKTLQNPKLWMAIAISALGLTPIIWFNLSNQLASASFYLVERHPWEFQPRGLLHIFIQAGLVSPPLYGLLGLTLWQMITRARAGDQNAAMLASFALTNLLVYMILAPWTDSASTTIHWPLSGYFPLLVFAPA